jgi:glyoxylase I family protein
MLARFAHVNLVARDWERLAAFYGQVFGCTPVYPARDLRGPWLERATGVPGAHIRGIHLRLPGAGPDGPTLEILQYDVETERAPTAANRPGLGHLAFAVEDVEAAAQQVVAAGGALIGELASATIPGVGDLVFVYAADPEGNLIELQRWAN